MFGSKYAARKAVLDEDAGLLVCNRCIPAFYRDEVPGTVRHGSPDYSWSEDAFYVWTCQSEPRARRFAWLYAMDIDEASCVCDACCSKVE